jgi:hypothetical protein
MLKTQLKQLLDYLMENIELPNVSQLTNFEI